MIRWVAYELYKKDWQNTNISFEEQRKAYIDYVEYSQECKEYGFRPDSFDDWFFENGYEGTIYACYDEFLECEYLDEKYMKYLFNDNKLLMSMYKEDIVKEIEEIELCN